MCCGRPNLDRVNACGRDARWVVVGPQVFADHQPVVCVLACCDHHRKAVEEFQSRFDHAVVAPIEALDAIKRSLGDDYVTPLHAAI